MCRKLRTVVPFHVLGHPRTTQHSAIQIPLGERLRQGHFMNFDAYQEQAGQTAIYPNRGSNLTYPVLGLSGEAGEVAEKLKKVIRDQGGELNDETRAALSKELGDVLWYIAACCHELGIQMGDVASANLQKLAARQERGKIQGSGDNR